MGEGSDTELATLHVHEILSECQSISDVVVANPRIQKLLNTDPWIDSRDFTRQVLLHIPQFSPLREANGQAIHSAIDIAIELVTSSATSASALFSSRPLVQSALQEFKLKELDQLSASEIVNTLHYLRSAREDAKSYGLTASLSQSIPHALATISPFDLENLEGNLPRQPLSSRIKVLSRVLGFPWTPKNAISLMLSKIYVMLRADGITDLLLSYINPNLGFDGASLNASGWSMMAYEQKPYYLYEKQRYVTERHCLRKYGTAKFEILEKISQGAITRSLGDLAPTLVYGFFLEGNEGYRQNPSTPKIVNTPFTS